MHWKKHLNKRLLVQETYSRSASVDEVVLVEVSPGGRIKLRWESGHTSWIESDKYRVVEVLPEKPDHGTSKT